MHPCSVAKHACVALPDLHSAAPPTASASLQSGRNRSSRQSFAGRYFFYKNVVYTFTLFWFNLLAGYSGQRMYDDWYHSMYNLIFTSMPVIAVGLLDQDVSKARSARCRMTVCVPQHGPYITVHSASLPPPCSSPKPMLQPVCGWRHCNLVKAGLQVRSDLVRS